MHLFSKPDYCKALSLRDRLREEIIFWQKKIMDGQKDVISTAHRMIDRRRCQLNKLDMIKQREKQFKMACATA